MAGSAVALVTTFTFDFFFFLYALSCLFYSFGVRGIRGLGLDLGEMEFCGFTVFHYVDAMI